MGDHVCCSQRPGIPSSAILITLAVGLLKTCPDGSSLTIFRRPLLLHAAGSVHGRTIPIEIASESSRYRNEITRCHARTDSCGSRQPTYQADFWMETHYPPSKKDGREEGLREMRARVNSNITPRGADEANLYGTLCNPFLVHRAGRLVAGSDSNQSCDLVFTLRLSLLIHDCFRPRHIFI